MPAPIKTEVFGVTYKSLTQACEAFGHAEPKVRHRMSRSMTLEQALVSRDRYTGAKKHPSYPCWNAIRSRCYSKGNASYARYGGRGIVMCDSWKNDFWEFVKDMGCRPSEKHTIDRIDNQKGYFKANCRWATMQQQANNRSTNVPVGCYPSLAAAARAAGRHPDTIRYRLDSGKSREKVLSPADARKKINRTAEKNPAEVTERWN